VGDDEGEGAEGHLWLLRAQSTAVKPPRQAERGTVRARVKTTTRTVKQGGGETAQ
jgi:hypothetical protein